jgi:hypothetical protein
MKRISAIAACMLLPVLIFAAENTVAKDSTAFRAIDTLSAAGAAVMQPVKDSYTRKEVSVYIKNALEKLLAAGASPSKETLETAFVSDRFNGAGNEAL